MSVPGLNHHREGSSQKAFFRLMVLEREEPTTSVVGRVTTGHAEQARLEPQP